MLVLEQINLLLITIDILQYNYHDSDSKNCIVLFYLFWGQSQKEEYKIWLKSHDY